MPELRTANIFNPPTQLEGMIPRMEIDSPDGTDLDAVLDNAILGEAIEEGLAFFLGLTESQLAITGVDEVATALSSRPPRKHRDAAGGPPGPPAWRTASWRVCSEDRLRLLRAGAALTGQQQTAQGAVLLGWRVVLVFKVLLLRGICRRLPQRFPRRWPPP